MYILFKINVKMIFHEKNFNFNSVGIFFFAQIYGKYAEIFLVIKFSFFAFFRFIPHFHLPQNNYLINVNIKSGMLIIYGFAYKLLI